MDSGKEINIKDILFIVKKYIALILILTVTFGAVGFIVSKFFIVPKYQADATLIVNPAANTKTTQITFDQVNTAQHMVDTYAIILKSNTVLEKVINDLNLDTDAKSLSKNITVSGVDESEVIEISVKDKNPEMAENIANDIIKVAPDIIIKTVKAGSVEIISDAKAENKPVSPNVLLYTAAAFIAGAVVSFIVIFCLESLNNKIMSEEDIQKHLGLTVIGIIPCYEENR